MKLTLKSLTLFLLCTFFTCAQAESFRLSYETISASEIEKNPKYQSLKQIDPGHHQTIIRIYSLPEGENYTLKWERPLFIKKDHHHECSKEVFTRLKEFLSDENLLFVTSSRGFVPGETVTWSLETADGTHKTEKISFIPNPIIQEIPLGGAKLRVELVGLRPTYYEIYLDGVPNETLTLKSRSSGEIIDQDFYYTKGSCMAISPDVIGKSGGFCDLALIRSTGGQFKLRLPWGEEALEHIFGEQDPITPEFTPISENNAAK
ncbi:MAG: hypothetical protein AB7H48_01555 [Parachlamydiales bacterium]